MKKIFKLPENLEQKKMRRADDINLGFSFVETLAVLAVSAVLATQVSISGHNIIQKAKVSAAKNQIELFKIALQSYYIDNGSFPTDEQGLQALWQKTDFYPVPENWNGPYTDKKIQKDPWGNDYVYKKGTSSQIFADSPEGIPYVIVSYGADKNEGGTGFEKDICSWKDD